MRNQLIGCLWSLKLNTFALSNSWNIIESERLIPRELELQAAQYKNLLGYNQLVQLILNDSAITGHGRGDDEVLK
jgi:hypothetical protein